MIRNFGHCSVRMSLQSDEKLHVNIYSQNITGKTSLLRFFSDSLILNLIYETLWTWAESGLLRKEQEIAMTLRYVNMRYNC